MAQRPPGAMDMCEPGPHIERKLLREIALHVMKAARAILAAPDDARPASGVPGWTKGPT